MASSHARPRLSEPQKKEARRIPVMLIVIAVIMLLGLGGLAGEMFARSNGYSGLSQWADDNIDQIAKWIVVSLFAIGVSIFAWLSMR